MDRNWHKEVDVVVVGSGASGCAAALAAQDHGLEPLVLEKGAAAGGGTSYSSGGIWIPESHLECAAGIADSRAEAIAYLHFLGAGFEVEENLRAYVDNAADALLYFERLGLKVAPFSARRSATPCARSRGLANAQGGINGTPLRFVIEDDVEPHGCGAASRPTCSRATFRSCWARRSSPRAMR